MQNQYRPAAIIWQKNKRMFEKEKNQRPVVLLLLLYHIKHAHLWLRPLITAVFLRLSQGVRGFGAAFVAGQHR